MFKLKHVKLKALKHLDPKPFKIILADQFQLKIVEALKKNLEMIELQLASWLMREDTVVTCRGVKGRLMGWPM